ncbi:hypothetical protein [Halomontanus rarus]|uniref:hypothetical protein n=1 Tax=Halomontanus rarus TaxID=3034020 RepID=UPI0023E86E1B|nr:hypothetical protein [Halovivax sp. TS33]
MKRRALLAWAGLTPFGVASGCLKASESDDTADTSAVEKTSHPNEADEDDIVIDVENDSTRSNGSGEHTEDDSLVAEDAGGYDESRQDPIFIGNTTDSEITVQLTLVSESEGETVISGEYTIPEKEGIEIPEITDVGEAYEITVESGEKEQKFEWTISTCAVVDGPEPGYYTKLYVTFSENDIRFSSLTCDETIPWDHNVEYDHHEKYQTS